MVVVRLEIFSVIIFSTFSFSQLLQATTARQKTRALAPRAQIYQCLPLQRDVLGRLERGLEKLALRAAVLTVSPQLGGDEYLQEKFMLHFKENTPETRRIVGQRFQAIAAEARSSGGGSVPITCIDLQERCRDNFQYAYVDDTGYILVTAGIALVTILQLLIFIYSVRYSIDCLRTSLNTTILIE